MELLPIIAITVTGAVGFCLMLAAIVMVRRRGGWQQSMQPEVHGRWPAPRRLMVAGAILGTLFSLLMFLPGVVPWWDYSSPDTTWGLGAMFGFGVGALTLLLLKRQPAG